jgi:DNA-binding GntR family transcriptional regulator
MPQSVPPPEINPRARQPPHRQISAWLEQRIRAGEFNPPGEVPLSSEADLVEQFGVARDTVRKSFAWLREQGYIETEHGRGSYTVDEWHEGVPVGRARELLRAGMVEMTIAEQLGVTVGQLHRALRQADDRRRR